MPVIKARTRRVPMVRHICRLSVADRDILVAYGKMIGDTTDYVLGQLIQKYLATDPDLRRWVERPNAQGATVPDNADSVQPDDIGIPHRSTQRRL